MKRNYWSIFFALILLVLGGAIFFLVHKQSLKAVSLEMFIDVETSQVIQMDINEVGLLKEINSLESDEASKSLVSQASDFVNAKMSFKNLTGDLNFIYSGYQLETVFIGLDKGLTKDWLIEHEFKTVSSGLYSNGDYFLKYQNKNLAISKSKKKLLNSKKSEWKSSMNDDAAIGLMDLDRGFTIDFYLEGNVLNQYKSTGQSTFENKHMELSVFRLIPENTFQYQLKSKQNIENVEGPVSWLGNEFVEMKLSNGAVAVASYSGLFHPDELIEEWSSQDSINETFLIGDIRMKPLDASFDHHFLKAYNFAGKYENFIIFADSKKAIKSWYLSIVSSHSVNLKDISWIPSNYSNFVTAKSFNIDLSLEGHFYHKDLKMKQVLLSNNFSCTKTDMVLQENTMDVVMSDWSLACSKPILGKVVKSKSNGSFGFIFQDEKNVLSYIDAQGKLVWTKALTSPILDEISIAEVTKNGRNDFIFNTDSHFYILDEQGKVLSGFPVLLPLKATSSVAALDYDNNRNYRFLIGCENGKVLNFDKKGVQVNGWSHVSLGVRISSKMEHFVIDGKDYLQSIDDSGAQNLLGRDGVPRNFDSIRVTNPYIFKKGKDALSSRFYQLTNLGIKTMNLTGQTDMLPVALEGMKFVKTYHTNKNDYFVVTLNGRLKLISKLGIVELEIPLIDSEITNLSFIENNSGLLTYFVFSDDKNLYLYNTNGILQNGFPIETESVFYLIPAKDETLNAVLTYANGLLKRETLMK
jgi:hypothetical protein